MAAAAKKNTGLGKGLSALFGDDPPIDPNAPGSADERKDAVSVEPSNGSAPSKSPITLPIEFLIPNPDQPRRIFNEDALAELAASIGARGMLQPILVRPREDDTYEIVAGERRWRAAQRAQLHEVPVVIRELNDTEAAEIALIENVQRVDLNPVEEAEAYQRLADHYGRTQEQISKAVGKSRSHVANIMRLLSLPERSLAAVKAGEISMGHARALLAVDDPDGALDLVLTKNLSVRDTERLSQDAKAKSPKSKGNETIVPPADAKPKANKDADTRSLERDLEAALGLEVAIDHSKSGAGVVTVKYLNLDQLDDVCRRLMGTSI